jgi:putative endonuclease
VFFTYLLASAPYGTLYCGHTDNLTRRIGEHKSNFRQGFTAKYGVHRLVWFEAHDTREGAKTQERWIKKWNRAWKIRLIEEDNRDWCDLYDELVNWTPVGPPAEWATRYPQPQAIETISTSPPATMASSPTFLPSRAWASGET